MPKEPEVPYPVAEFLRAVEAEVAAIVKDDAPTGIKVALHNGRQVERSEAIRVYLFACKAWKAAFTGKDLLIRPTRPKSPWERAEAVRMPDGVIRVTTAADLGTEVQGAELIEDDTTGLVVLADRLRQAGDPKGPVNLATAGWLCGQGSPRVGNCAEPGHFIRDYHNRQLNARQRSAVEQALGSDVTFIWGPPGTGKTEVVGCTVEGCYRQGLRVLFVAPTHVAVDQALERMCELLCGEEEFAYGLIQRTGEITTPSLSAKYGDEIIPERIAQRLSAQFDEQIARIEAQVSTIRTDITVYEEVSLASAELRRQHEQKQEIDRELTRIDAAGRAEYDAMRDVQRRIDESGTPKGIFGQRKQVRLEYLQQELTRHSLTVEGFRQQRAAVAAEQQRSSDSVAAADSRLNSLTGLLHDKPQLGQLQELETRLQEHLSQLQGERQKITESVRSRCRVMGATVTKAVQSRKLMEAVDVVVIDEAGMVDLPSAWCAAGLASRRVIVAGDFRQLPAVTRGSTSRAASESEKEHSRTWMDRDVFHAAGLVSSHGTANIRDPRMVALNEQYRMRPEICSVVNTVAYPDAPLTTGRPDGSRLPRSPLIDGPLILVDTSYRAMDGTSREAHKSNTVHEAVVHELIRGLQYDSVLPARKWTNVPEGSRPTDRLAVIVPYNNQKRHLATSLKYRFGESYEGLIDTVHRFQGSQRPLVIIDTVAGAGSKVGYFYEGTGLDSATCRLLNVALSRAQDHLVVVANVAFLRAKLDERSPVVRMLDALERNAQRLNLDDLIPIRSAAELAGLDQDELARPAFFPADEVQRAVEWDIQNARNSIDIYCAFLDPEPVRRWSRLLSKRVSQGVRVRIHTRRHDSDGRAAQLVGELEDSGFEVSARERMHEKVMIVDETVLWHGSLNLFANKGPTDLMMRITDPTSCARVRYIVDRARMERPARTPFASTSSPRRGDAARTKTDLEPGAVHDGRRYLDVPFEEKDEAKRTVRAKWDPSVKLWHVDAAVPIDLVRRWLPQ